MRGHELHVGPILDPGAASARSAEQGQLHRARVGLGQRGGQFRHKFVCAGKADFGVLHAKGRHPLQQPGGVGHGDVEVRLLHPIAEARVEQLGFSGFSCLHLTLHPFASDPVNNPRIL